MKAPAWFQTLVIGSLLVPSSTLSAQDTAAKPPEPESQTLATDTATPTFKTTVRRVVLDVVVTDANGNPVPGLKKEDFSIAEDGKLQTVLSFDPYGFDQTSDYQPGKMPPLPVNTFVNLPTTPEKGPLYILLYDMVNMDADSTLASGQHADQIWGRQQLVKFIQSKPEGARFAIFVWSDGLHLIQGFTADKAQLFAAIDPRSSRPHIPEVFMMGDNFGRGDVHSTIDILNYIGGYLEGMPGRKNLIWFSGGFPLSFFPTKNDGPNYVARVKATLNLLAQDQIAIYPVDVRGVVSSNAHSANGPENNGNSDSNDSDKPSANGAPSTDTQADAARTAGAGAGMSLLNGSYMDMDEIAKETGGRAFYSNNQVAAALTAATNDGASYYSLTYSPSDRNYDGKLRLIHVELARKGYHLAYRHTYYAADHADVEALAQDKSPTAAAPERPSDSNDTLYASMKHGAPTAHQLVFGAHVHPLGPPAKGTPEQMAQLATQPAYLAAARKKALAPIPLQKFAIDYTVTTRQLHLQAGTPLNLQIAAAAYDNDGVMLNAVVHGQTENIDATAGQPAKPYRVEQQIDVPMVAAYIRIAVRDVNTDRVGAMEIKLPLAPENESAAK